MRLFARLFRLVWGDEVDRALRPVLAVSFAGAVVFPAGWSFVGIWAIEELGDYAAWYFFAAVSVTAAASGAAAVRAAVGRRRGEPLSAAGL